MDFTKVDRFLDSLVGELVPSNDLIVMRDHRLLHRHITGYSDFEARVPLTGDELYFMYSATKPVTCAAAMILYERGLFSLDMPLCEYLPEFRDMTVTFTDTDGKKKNRPAKTEITVRDLFTMTAGFDYNIQSSPLRIAKEKTAPMCPTREMVRALASVPLSFDPGTRWQYSLCHDVIPALAEEVSGVPFRRFVKEHIFDPLEMKDSVFDYSEVKGRIAPLYLYFDKDNAFRRVPTENEYIFGTEYDSGGAGITSTTADMAKFADMMASGGTAPDGERILSPETVKLMSTNVLTPSLATGFDWPQYRDYGYGLGVRTLITKELGARSSLGEFGWAGAAGAYILCDPAEKLSIFCTRHMLNNKEAEITPRLRDLVYEALGINC